MAKAKTDETTKDISTPETTTDAGLEQAISDLKDQVKILENEKVELSTKLTQMDDLKIKLEAAEQKIIDLQNTITELESDRTKNEKDIQSLIDSIQKIKDENQKLKESNKLTNTITETESGPYKYHPDDWVTYPARFQKLRFQVRELLGTGVRGPLYRLYCYDNDIALSHIPESELQPVTNRFRGE